MTLLTAVESAAAVRSGTLTAVDATRAALARIEAGAPLGAFQVVRAERALAEAAAVDARADLSALSLAGVPIAIKDNIPVAGEPMRDGSAATSAAPQSADHELVARLRAAGAIVVGITRVPELCVFGTTDSVYGLTRNPWNPERAPGGSSGGSAAAVASGQVPFAHGNDGMGSVRIPAANCGLVGIKPGKGLVPQDIGVDAWLGMSENGPLATTVADAALLLSVMAGRPGLASPVEPSKPLRIAIAAGEPSPLVSLDPEWRRGLAETADALRGAGHLVTEVTFPYDPNPLPLLARWFAGTATDAEMLDPARLERRVRVHARLGRIARRAGLLKDAPVDRLRARVHGFFADYDLLLTPTLAQPGPVAGGWHERGWWANMISNIRYAPYPSTWNLLGWPAASIPAGWHATAKVPLAVQIIAEPKPDGAAEALILSLASQLERLRPWPRIAPGFAE
ncbi:amidase [Glaciihabitans sp. INWT7]|uniref:amidase n=1 Tax=Glaciihabitans sp. INWT7 TaxID=2596912 RepID=UPI001627E15F|nr:amidase [Glaciihabitans sp. INWT7]QNE47390.1 amidase [Glaciihabitans sp. INWT7]